MQEEPTCSSELTSDERKPLAELSDEEIRLIGTTADFETLCARSSEVGMVLRSFKDFFARYQPIVEAMMKRFPARGSHRKLEIGGKQYTKSEYCRAIYGVSDRWVNSLLSGEYLAAEETTEPTAEQDATAEQNEPQGEGETDKKTRTAPAGTEAADVKAELRKVKKENARMKAEYIAMLEKTDDYACFQRCDSLQDLARELVTASLTCTHIMHGYQEDKMLSDLFWKEIKAQRKEAADAKPKSAVA